ncbi:MAG: SDR family NAD(P)-dependent oxidoreductase [Pseudomonadota bacterium]
MKTALLTGSTGGLGQEIALILAKQDWNLILLNRNADQAEEQLANLRVMFPEQSFDSFIADMLDLEELGQTAREIALAYTEISALFNIAGLLTDKRITSAQGIEGHFAVNAVAPYFLISILRPQLEAAATREAPAFIVNFSTSAVNNVKSLDVEKLVNPDKIGGLLDAYAKTKSVLNVMSEFLKFELYSDHVYIYSVDPGPTKTQMTSDNGGMPWFVRLLVPIMFGDAEKQSRKLMNAISQAVSHDQTGIFISNGKTRDNPIIAEDPKIQMKVRGLLDQLLPI